MYLRPLSAPAHAEPPHARAAADLRARASPGADSSSSSITSVLVTKCRLSPLSSTAIAYAQHELFNQPLLVRPEAPTGEQSGMRPFFHTWESISIGEIPRVVQWLAKLIGMVTSERTSPTRAFHG